MNALTRVISDKAQRVDRLNCIRLEAPIAGDAVLQLRTIEEALEIAKELQGLTEEAIGMLEKDHNEHLEVYQK